MSSVLNVARQPAARALHMLKTPCPDVALAKLFKARYIVKEVDGAGTTPIRLSYCPRTVTNYWKVARVMQQQGLIPFVHGQSAIWSIPQQVLKKYGFDNLYALRPLSLRKEDSSDKIKARIETHLKEVEANYQNSWMPSRRLYYLIRKPKGIEELPDIGNQLLSVTLGLFHCEQSESPLSFVIGGSGDGIVSPMRSINPASPGNRNMLGPIYNKKIANEVIMEAMRSHYSREAIVDLQKKLEPLYEKAENLSTGQILTIGVPVTQLSNAVYHSLPFGKPTGIPMQKVIEMISQSVIPKEGCQARLMFSSDTMDPASGIKVVNVMDQDEVQNYCKDAEEEVDVTKEEALKDILIEKSTRGEEAFYSQYNALKAEVSVVLKNIK